MEKSDVKRKLYRSNMIISEEKFQEAKAKLFEYLRENKEVVVRDYCHWTGKFRGAANQTCTLLCRKTKRPTFFHNFTGYESHHVFMDISNLEKQPKI